MSTITPHYRSVQQLLQTQSFSIDEYQREYKWGKENIDELLSDLQEKFLGSYRPGDETKEVSSYEEYFLGSIIVSKRGSTHFLIDGQQRVTSLTLLLICLYRIAKKKGWGVAQTLAPLIFSDNLGQPRFNLDIQERLPVIEALFHNSHFNPVGKDESVQTMYARFGDIEQHELITELGDTLPHFSYWLLTQVGLIEISTDNDNYAYAIFETMNDRGKPLSPVDMLKAYALAPIDDANKRKNANETWKKEVLDLLFWNGVYEAERDANCIKAFLRAQFAETIRDRKVNSSDKDWELIGTAFHRWARDNSTRLKLGTPQENLAWITCEFPFFARAYRLILNASHHYQKGLEAVYFNANNDFTWQNTVLLAPLVSTDTDDIVRRKIAVTATYLDIWLMRRAVNFIRVGYSSTSYTMWLLCKDIRSRPLTELVAILTQKLKDDDVTFEGAPAKGRGGIDDFSLNQASRRYVFHLLARLSAFTDVGAGRADLFETYVDRHAKNSFDIEHIWADNFADQGNRFASVQEFQDWRNQVASLLLLPADVNRSLQAKSYGDKTPHYAKQNVYAASLSSGMYQHQPQFEAFRTLFTLSFKAFTTFGKPEQLERRQLVKDLVNRVWSSDRLRKAAE